MKGKFYGVGIGPGDPDLITIKAVNILGKCDYIVLPKAHGEDKSTAYSIAKKFINKDCKKLEISFPMSKEKSVLEYNRNKAADAISEILDLGFDAVFITLGDPTVYSTCMYEYKILKDRGYECEIIPGVTSFCAAAAKAGISLCEDKESFAVIPAYDGIDVSGTIVGNIDNFVIMKAYKNIGEIKNTLKNNGFNNNVWAVTKCGLEGEKIYRSLNDIDDEGLSYFTTVIVKRDD